MAFFSFLRFGTARGSPEKPVRGGPSPRVDFTRAVRTRAEAVSTRRCGRSEPKVLSALFGMLLRRQNRPVLADARRVAGVKRAVLQALCLTPRVFKFLGNARLVWPDRAGPRRPRRPAAERSRGPTAASAWIGTSRFIPTARRPVVGAEWRYPSTRTPSTRTPSPRQDREPATYAREGRAKIEA